MIEVNDARKLPFIWLNLALDDAGLNPYEFRIYVHVVRRAGKNGECFETVANMAANCNMSTGSAKRALKGLIDKQMLARESRSGTTSIYRIEDIEQWATEGDGQNRSTPLPGSEGSRGGSEGSRGGSEGSRGGSETTHKEDPFKQIPLNKSPEENSPLTPQRGNGVSESNKSFGKRIDTPEQTAEVLGGTNISPSDQGGQAKSDGSKAKNNKSAAPKNKGTKKKSVSARKSLAGQTEQAVIDCLVHDPGFEDRVSRMWDLWNPFFKLMRGTETPDSPIGFRSGFAWIISPYAGKYRMSPEEVEEAVEYYVTNKTKAVNAGQSTSQPPAAIRFFQGKDPKQADHPEPYCLLALQGKRDKESSDMSAPSKAERMAQEMLNDLKEMSQEVA
ncbi:helix-turn-helix domain-containing protein [Leptothoe spongobia]|uniref:Helix-turn-helix domain-containing protein n=1 Tax=Leptothoe spongobia TAU-MAC 1115 TaxID=1967444 RepID=A0A947DG63_9CYAN|nr:helix-turn-helix domain-containing protein [Leptothoe spongobia]MBT9316261.1 helix-turn-helix domain-containing protein [Leptothoe spongobia TAU-MAC 1115]